MIVTALRIPGAYTVDIAPLTDERGFFARSWCATELANAGLETRIAQCNISFTAKRGTLRGMHYQDRPHAEEKLVRCTRGAVYDVVLDLRPDSPTFRDWQAIELTAENRRAVYVPMGCAHGFQALTDGVELLYHMSDFHRDELARGVRWNDPAFRISWPIANPLVSPRDAAFTDFRP